jgi:uncharacterized peroxidase-related enzyme
MVILETGTQYKQPNNIPNRINPMSNNILKPLTVESATPEVRSTLQNIQKGFGFVPNLMATFANSPAVLHGYLGLDAAWEKGTFTPIERQLVLLAASVTNDCGYCVAAHSTVLKAFLKVSPEVVAAVRNGDRLENTRHEALVNFAKEVVSQRGRASEASVQAFLAAGYTAPQVMEVLLGVALKTISNYLDHLNPTPLDAAFAAEAK